MVTEPRHRVPDWISTGGPEEEDHLKPLTVRGSGIRSARTAMGAAPIES